MGEGPQPAVPALRHPDLEVGLNYPWLFNRYGTHIGPRDIENDPPTGAKDKTPVWMETGLPEGTLARNLDILKSEFRITKVRMFLMCNMYNYGKHPLTDVTPSGKSFFTAPPSLHPLFTEHFQQMLQVFKSKNMQILPSLIDFGAIYPKKGSGGGRTSIVTSQRQRFLETVVVPMVDVSKAFRETIFAWEVINEPYWNILGAFGFSRPHTPDSGPDVASDVYASFINEILGIFERAGFASTVGHRFFGDLTDGVLPVGKLPQFHYYPKFNRFLPNLGPLRSDPVTLPDKDELAKSTRTKGAFIGEFATDFVHDAPWDECNGADATPAGRTFERLKVIAKKGYKLAFLWPDLPDQPKDDALRLSAETKASLKRFTTGLFPNGVPP